MVDVRGMFEGGKSRIFVLNERGVYEGGEWRKCVCWIRERCMTEGNQEYVTWMREG